MGNTVETYQPKLRAMHATLIAGTFMEKLANGLGVSEETFTKDVSILYVRSLHLDRVHARQAVVRDVVDSWNQSEDSPYKPHSDVLREGTVYLAARAAHEMGKKYPFLKPNIESWWLQAATGIIGGELVVEKDGQTSIHPIASDGLFHNNRVTRDRATTRYGELLVELESQDSMNLSGRSETIFEQEETTA